MFKQEDTLFSENASIIEAWKKVAAKESNSVSDVEVPSGKKKQLDDSCDYKKMEESESYVPFKGQKEWQTKAEEAGLTLSPRGSNKIDVLDQKGNMQGWYNPSVDMGYLHKDHCKVPTLQESEKLEEATALQKCGVVHDAIDKAHFSGGSYLAHIASEMRKRGMDPTSGVAHRELDHYVSDLTGGKYVDHLKYGHDKQMEKASLKEELSPEQLEKRDKFVINLKKSKEDFKNRYGDDWEGVLFATATKLAKGE